SGRQITYHPVNSEKPVWDEKEQGIDTTDFSSQSIERLEKNRKTCLELYARSINWRFKVKGTSIVDHVREVDYCSAKVIGRHFGSFHIDVCELVPSCSPSFAINKKAVFLN
ncbi:MAG TPA: hypothetical protein VF610_04580, partial [Segetibacter sp.]